jgi:hypothetical protein
MAAPHQSINNSARKLVGISAEIASLSFAFWSNFALRNPVGKRYPEPGEKVGHQPSVSCPTNATMYLASNKTVRFAALAGQTGPFL